MSRMIVSTSQTYGPVSVANGIASGVIDLFVCGKIGFVTSRDAIINSASGVIFTVPSQYSTKLNMNFPICVQKNIGAELISYVSNYGWFNGSSASTGVGPEVVGWKIQFALAYPIA